MLRSPRLTGLVALVLASRVSYAQQPADEPSCPPAIPVTAMLPDGTLLTQMGRADFDARVHGHSIAIATVDEDVAPRRVVLVLDTSRNVNAEAWKIETSLSRFLLESAPAQVSFAVVILNADASSLGFGSSRETLNTRLADFVSVRPANAKSSEDVYGGLMSALQLLGPEQFGDTMFAFFGGADNVNRIDVGAVQRAFAERGLRLFGMILGEEARSGFYMIAPGGPEPHEVPYDPDSDETGHLAVETGGLLAVENTRLQQMTYHLTDDRLKQLETTCHRFLSQIIMPYRMQLSAGPIKKREELSIDLAATLKEKLPSVRVLFPHQLAACSSSDSR